jgi:hypothetical protein
MIILPFLYGSLSPPITNRLKNPHRFQPMVFGSLMIKFEKKIGTLKISAAHMLPSSSSSGSVPLPALSTGICTIEANTNTLKHTPQLIAFPSSTLHRKDDNKRHEQKINDGNDVEYIYLQLAHVQVKREWSLFVRIFTSVYVLPFNCHTYFSQADGMSDTQDRLWMINTSSSLSSLSGSKEKRKGLRRLERTVCDSSILISRSRRSYSCNDGINKVLTHVNDGFDFDWTLFPSSTMECIATHVPATTTTTSQQQFQGPTIGSIYRWCGRSTSSRYFIGMQPIFFIIHSSNTSSSTCSSSSTNSVINNDIEVQVNEGHDALESRYVWSPCISSPLISSIILPYLSIRALADIVISYYRTEFVSPPSLVSGALPSASH